MAEIGPNSALDPLEYLSHEELSRLDERFDDALLDADCLVFWTGFSHELALCWADHHGLHTLVSAMGSLFSNCDVGSPRYGKSPKAWSKYMKGASIRFAEYACRGRRAVVLTNPPPDIYSTRKHSNYQNLEEPILKGAIANSSTVRIDYVHPTIMGAITFQYQTWPLDKSLEWFAFLRSLLQKESSTLCMKQIVTKGDSAIQLQAIMMQVGFKKLAQKDQTTACQKGVRRNKVGMEQQKSQEKKRAKRQRAKLEQQKAQEKKLTKRQRAQLEQQEAQERKLAKRQRAQLEQQKAQEKKRAKQQRAELEQQKAQEKKRAKQQSVELLLQQNARNIILR